MVARRSGRADSGRTRKSLKNMSGIHLPLRVVCLELGGEVMGSAANRQADPDQEALKCIRFSRISILAVAV